MVTWNVQLLSSCAGGRARQRPTGGGRAHCRRGSQNFGNQSDNPALQQQPCNDDESGNEYDGSDDEKRNHLEPLLCFYRNEDNQPHNQQQKEHAANGEVNNFVNQNNNPVQQNKANDDDKSGDEYDDSDDEMRNHSEPLLSYHEDNQRHN
jgi:hypothetical protein